MNCLGRLFRVQLFGESHGPGVVVGIDGCPAGLAISEKDLAKDLGRRRAGAPGTTARREADIPRFLAGLFEGRTTGAPLLVGFENREVDSAPYAELRFRPRPGHADLVARQKWAGFNDPRGGGAFSGRLTVGLVAAGAVARKLVPGVKIRAWVAEAGGSPDVEAAVRAAAKAGEPIGGVVACAVEGLPPGLGEPFFDSFESCLAHALFAIPAVKGFELGDGFLLARMRASECRDTIVDVRGRTRTHHLGGVHGGLTSGNPVLFRVAVRPASSGGPGAWTVDLRTGRRVRLPAGGRHDLCIALRVPVIVEAAAAIVVADLMLLAQRVGRVAARGPKGGRGRRRS